MAVDTTTYDISPTFHPIINLARVGPQSEVPRGELIYHSGVLAKAVEAGGDSQFAKIDMALPLSFGYAISFIVLEIWGDDVVEWDDCAFAYLQGNTGGGNTQWTIPLKGEAIMDSLSGGQRMYSPVPGSLPPHIVLAQASGAKVCIQLGNITVNGSAMSLRSTVALNVYDLEQFFHAGVRTPTLVR